MSGVYGSLYASNERSLYQLKVGVMIKKKNKKKRIANAIYSNKFAI